MIFKDFVARKIFVEISKRLRSKNDKEHIITILCSSLANLTYFSSLTLSSIYPEALRNFDSLTSLDLSGNMITKIRKNSFRNLTNLVSLNLSGNRLEYLPTGLFSSNKKLKTLHICIENLTTNSFLGLGMLQELDLILMSKNKIDIARFPIFQSLISLKKLTFKWSENDYFQASYCEENEMSEPEENVWTELYLTKNKSEITFFKGLGGKLNELTLNGLNNNILRSNCFKTMPNLIKLNLEENSLESISYGLLAGLKSVTQLKLGFNEIKFIGKDSFKDMPNLQTLKLNDNKLEAIKQNDFTGLTKLEVLDLLSNPIKAVEQDFMKKLKSLKNLNMDDNSLILTNVGQKLVKIEEESFKSSLKHVIINHFKEIKNKISSLEEKTSQIKVFEKFNKKVEELEAFNLNEFEKNQSLIISNLKSLDKSDPNTKDKQLKELIKQNCWLIDNEHLKNTKYESKFENGVLVVMDFYTSNEDLSNFK